MRLGKECGLCALTNDPNSQIILFNRLEKSDQSPICRFDKINPYKQNARKHSPKQIEQIAASIEEFGFTVPILIDDRRSVLAGHGRLEAAKLLGLSQVPTLSIGGLTAAEKKAYRIADNKLAENAEWEIALLSSELRVLEDLDLDFDLEITGFDTAELEVLLDPPQSEIAEDDVPVMEPEGVPVSRLGDLWHLGEHRLLCADSRDKDAFKQLLGRRKAAMVFTDPPYNVRISGHVGGTGQIKHKEFAMASGEMSPGEFRAFLNDALLEQTSHVKSGGLCYVCMDWGHLNDLLTVGSDLGLHLINICVWVKTNGGMGSFYRSQHEMVAVFRVGKGPHLNNIELGKHGRYRTNVWRYAGANTFRAGPHGRSECTPNGQALRVGCRRD